MLDTLFLLMEQIQGIKSSQFFIFFVFHISMPQIIDFWFVIYWTW